MTVRVARLTPPGIGAIATIAVVGRDAWQVLSGLFRRANGEELDDSPLPDTLHFGKFGTTVGDEVVLALRPDTSEPWFEIHCHGGREVVAWIIEQLVERRATVVDWTELEQTHSWIRLEASAQLSRALTLNAANVLLAQQRGALEATLQAIRDQIIAGAVDEANDAIEKLLATARVGLRLTTPFRIAICGAPNVGKSSLINRIAGYERAVVSPIAGTTREITTTIMAIGGWPIALYDSPGIRESHDVLEVEGVRSVVAALELGSFDAKVWVIDQSSANADVASSLGSFDMTVINKCDLNPADCAVSVDAATIRVSALTGDGVPELLDRLGQLVLGDVPLDRGVLFSEELAHAVQHALNLLHEGQLQRSQQVLDALLQPAKPHLSLPAPEPRN